MTRLLRDADASAPVSTSRLLPDGVSFPPGPEWPATVRYREIVLRALRRSDKTRWERVRQLNREWLREWDATPPPGSELPPASFGEMARRLNRRGHDGTMLPWAICIDDTYPDQITAARKCTFVGQVTVAGISYGSARWAHIGYWIDEAYAGRGIVPVSVALATDYCFQVLGLHRIEINIRPENHNSLRVVQKLGFRHEGLRPQYLHINGAWRDHEGFALHDDEIPEGVLNRYLAGR